MGLKSTNTYREGAVVIPTNVTVIFHFKCLTFESNLYSWCPGSYLILFGGKTSWRDIEIEIHSIIVHPSDIFYLSTKLNLSW